MSKEYKSSSERLAQYFELSRDKWKERSDKYYKEKRNLFLKLRDVIKSRDMWKNKCKQLQEENQKLLEDKKKVRELLTQIADIYFQQ